MQKEQGSKYKIELAYIQDADGKALPHEGTMLLEEKGKHRKYGAAQVKVNAATDEILDELMRGIMFALSGECNVQVVDTRGM